MARIYREIRSSGSLITWMKATMKMHHIPADQLESLAADRSTRRDTCTVGLDSGGSRKKIFAGPGPSSFGRQQRLSEIYYRTYN